MEHDEARIATLMNADEVTGELVGPTTAAAEVGQHAITVNTEAGAYELGVGGRTAGGVLLTETGSRVTILATSVFPEFRGRGIASELLGGVLDMLRAEGRTVTLTCPFATAFVESHSEYADLVDPTFPGIARRMH